LLLAGTDLRAADASVGSEDARPRAPTDRADFLMNDLRDVFMVFSGIFYGCNKNSSNSQKNKVFRQL
jgi:hypothetical protein